MEQFLAQRLRNSTKERLVLLVQELVSRHPTLAGEIESMLLSTQPAILSTNDEFSADMLILRRPLTQQSSHSFNFDVYQQHLVDYPLRLQQGTSPQDIFDDLVVLLQEAEWRADQYDYQQALSTYALVIDYRLALQNTVLIHIFDRSIDEFMPVLAMLLSESSSLTTPDDGPDVDNDVTTIEPIARRTHAELSPLLPLDKRQLWLKRLFSLWLKRLDNHYSEENLPEIMLEIAWSEDVVLLRSLIEKELHLQPANTHSNIVDFSRQSRTRILEKFLRELPHV
jgi:hypothetical protein